MGRSAGGWVAPIIVAIVLGLGAVIGSSYLESNCAPWQDPVSADLAIGSAESRLGRVHVSGTTDLPDGALLGYWVVPESELGELTSAPQHQAGGQVEVQRGRFSFSEDVIDWPEGRAVLEVWFSVNREEPQPDHLVAVFGDNGQCLTGPQVGVDSPGDPKVLHTDTTVVISY